MTVFDTRRVVTQVVHAVTEDVAELTRRAATVINAFGADKARAVPGQAFLVCEASVVVAEFVLTTAEDVADFVEIIAIRRHRTLVADSGRVDNYADAHIRQARIVGKAKVTIVDFVLAVPTGVAELSVEAPVLRTKRASL